MDEIWFWIWSKASAFLYQFLLLVDPIHTSAVFHGLQPSFDVDSFGFLLAMPKKPVLVTTEEFEELKKQLEVQKKLEICGNNDE